MRTPQLLTGVAGAALLLAVACNRTDADREAREAAAEVREAAAEAGGQVREVAAEAGDRLTDGWLTSKVQAQYFADRDIKARYIDVTTRDRVVTLSGYVDNLAARDEAVRIARNTEGVRSVDDKLKIGVSPSKETFATAAPPSRPVSTAGGAADYEATVRQNAAAAGGDDQITSMVQARFFLDPAIKAREVEVQTRNGVVTLRGAVANENERSQALLIARHTNGVGRVEDLLTVDARLAP
jgi:hyperosmotically inducible protein